MTSMLVALEESPAHPWYWGGGLLIIFLILISATLIIGKGREHS